MDLEEFSSQHYHRQEVETDIVAKIEIFILSTTIYDLIQVIKLFIGCFANQRNTYYLQTN